MTFLGFEVEIPALCSRGVLSSRLFGTSRINSPKTPFEGSRCRSPVRIELARAHGAQPGTPLDPAYPTS